MKAIGWTVLMILGGAAASIGYGFGAELAAEPAPAPVTIYDCKRRLATDLTVRCVCNQGGETYFCNWSTPKNRWGGPQK